MPEETESPPEGLVAGKYRLTELIGRGGMGSVWEGVHATLGTRVAVKFIDSDFADSDEARRRFENEARAAAALRTKHVVKVYDHGMMQDGRPYIVMEYLLGEPLDRRLERVGRLSLTDTASIVLQVSRALSKAHEAGIVHRDLKPENVFLVWDEEDRADIVKVVDFGIAKFTEGSVGMSSSTRTGSVLGTPQYMSPEQARGLRSVDFRSDLWSLAVIAYRAAVGRLPFDGEAIGDLLVKICTAPLPVPSQNAPGIPPAFDAWFARALERDPNQRFPSAAELARSLSEACGSPVRGALPSSGLSPSSGAPIAEAVAHAATVATGPFGAQAATVAPTTTATRPAPRASRGLWIALGAGVVVTGAAVGLVLALSGHGTKHARASAPSAAAREPAAAPKPAAAADSSPAAVEPSASVAGSPSAAPIEKPEVTPAVESAAAAHATKPAAQEPEHHARQAVTAHATHADKSKPINLGY
jgi:eukaryotic-like serine/threonine-protein kinase